MYDEMPRQQDHYWASLAYAQEEGRTEGMRLGIEQGRISELMDVVEECLSNQRYFHGNTITETDIRFYTTMIRFDAVYYGLYSANKKRIEEYPNIFNYLKDLYQTPEFGSTKDFEAIKVGYYVSAGRTIVPKGPEVGKWNQSHDRARFE